MGKEGDSQPGQNYCFQEGDGTTSTPCRGGGCGGGGEEQKIEEWIEKYFKKEMEDQNLFLRKSFSKIRGQVQEIEKKVDENTVLLNEVKIKVEETEKKVEANKA